MVGIDTIVWFVFTAIVVITVLLLDSVCAAMVESKLPMPMAWNIVRVVFVVLVVFLLIAILLGMLGHPIVRM